MINDFKFSFSKQQCRQSFITVCICFWEYHPFLCWDLFDAHYKLLLFINFLKSVSGEFVSIPDVFQCHWSGSVCADLLSERVLPRLEHVLQHLAVQVDWWWPAGQSEPGGNLRVPRPQQHVPGGVWSTGSGTGWVASFGFTHSCISRSVFFLSSFLLSLSLSLSVCLSVSLFSVFLSLQVGQGGLRLSLGFTRSCSYCPIFFLFHFLLSLSLSLSLYLTLCVSVPLSLPPSLSLCASSKLILSCSFVSIFTVVAYKLWFCTISYVSFIAHKNYKRYFSYLGRVLFLVCRIWHYTIFFLVQS